MRDRISISIKVVNGEQWGDLNALGLTHEFCGEKVDCKDNSFSFAGGHRVRLYQFKKNVHWKIPAGQVLDITGVAPQPSPKADSKKKAKKK